MTNTGHLDLLCHCANRKKALATIRLKTCVSSASLNAGRSVPNTHASNCPSNALCSTDSCTQQPGYANGSSAVAALCSSHFPRRRGGYGPCFSSCLRSLRSISCARTRIALSPGSSWFHMDVRIRAMERIAPGGLVVSTGQRGRESPNTMQFESCQKQFLQS